MKIATTAALGFSILAVAAGGASAQDAMMHMSHHDMMMMDHCKAMSHHRIMHNRGCMHMRKMHPGMMSHDGMMMKK